MPHTKPVLLIAVLDSRQAHFYLRQHDSFEKLEYVMAASKIRTDMPSTRHELGRAFSGGAGSRHIIEPHNSDEALQQQQFVWEVAGYLKESLEKKEFEELGIIAPPKILGLVRKSLSDAVKNAVTLEIDKDFIPLSKEQVQQHIENAIL